MTSIDRANSPHDDYELYDTFYECPNCKKMVVCSFYTYCPNCGKEIHWVGEEL